MSAKSLSATAFDYSVVTAETKGKLIAIAGQVRRGKDHYVKSVMELGEAIHNAHELLAGDGREGKFSEWLEAECFLERRTAYNYMWAFERFGKCEIISHLAPTAMYALAAPEAPKEASKEAVKLAGKGERITVAKAKELLDKFREVQQRATTRTAPAASPSLEPAKPQPTVEAAPEPEFPNECAPGKHKFDDDGGCTICNVQREIVEPEKPKPAEEPPASKLFSKLLEDIRQAVKGCDAIHNATGKKHARLHETVLNSLDIAGQEAQAWRRACK